MNDDIEKLLARKMFEIMREQKEGDVAALRALALNARERGYTEIADHADQIASLFELEDGTK